MLTLCAIAVQNTYVTVQNGKDAAVFSHVLGLPFFTRALGSLQVLSAAWENRAVFLQFVIGSNAERQECQEINQYSQS